MVPCAFRHRGFGGQWIVAREESHPDHQRGNRVEFVVIDVVAPLPLWMTERAVAERLGVSIYTVQRMRKRGELKAKRIGRRWKYRDDWIREYEDEWTPCQSSSESESGSSTGDPTAPIGVPAGSIQQLDRQDVHRSAQATFKPPRFASRNT